MAFILKNTEDGGNDIIALHETVKQLKEDRRTSYINEDEYVIRFDGDHYLYMEIDSVIYEPKVNEKSN